MHQKIAPLLGCLVLAACSSTPEPVQQSSVPARSESSQSARAPAAPNTSNSAASSQNVRGDNTAAATVPSKNSVYFDYDSTVVKDEYSAVVTAHARYLSSGQQRGSVRVEGNTDERGSREYNLALGQRRADAVKQRLTLMGVPANRIETVSFGEEKPRTEGENESAFAENRRADITYAGR